MNTSFKFFGAIVLAFGIMSTATANCTMTCHTSEKKAVQTWNNYAAQIPAALSKSKK